MKKIFIHCGLYKTGTTSLQKFLFDNRDQLKKQGLLYPNAGIPVNSKAQHHIARELDPAVLSDPKTGTINQLLQEIKQFSGNVAISSEFFADHLIYPRRWSYLLSHLKAIDYRPVLIIYLRDLFSFFESLYMQLLRDGYRNVYDTYLHRALEYGSIIFLDLELSIDYKKIKSALESHDGVDIIFRDYQDLVDGSSIADFLNLVGISMKGSNLNLPADRLNSQESFEIGLRRFHFNRSRLLELQYDKLVTSDAGDAFILINKMCDMDFKGFLTPEAHKARFRDKFAIDCKSLLTPPFIHEVVGLPHVSNIDESHDRDSYIDISRVFSTQTSFIIQNSSEALNRSRGFNHQQVVKLVEGNIKSWQSWVKNKA